MLVAGVDEAGRGPVIGPLVVCSVAMLEKDLYMLENIGVKDSKYLSPKKRQEIYDWFFEKMSGNNWDCSVIICPAKDIDAAVAHNGLNILETELFAEAINGLSSSTKQNLSIINDACDVNCDRFSNRIATKLNDWPWVNSSIESHHKADENYLIVGLASIIAKQTRDLAIKNIEEKLGFSIGSGYPSDKYTVSALEVLLKDEPHQDVRWSWKTSQKLWKKIHGSEIPKRIVPPKNQSTLF